MDILFVKKDASSTAELQRILELVRSLSATPGQKVDVDTDLLGLGVLDSIAMMELIVSLEEGMQMSIPEGEVLPENFKCVRAIYELVTRLVR